MPAVITAFQPHEWAASLNRAEWTEVMEVKSIAFLGEHNERERERHEMRGARRDTDENALLRAGTDMIMGELLVVVHHSPPPPTWLLHLSERMLPPPRSSCTQTKHTQTSPLLRTKILRCRRCVFLLTQLCW